MKQLRIDLVGQSLLVLGVILLIFFSVIETLQSLHVLVIMLAGIFLATLYRTVKMESNIDVHSIYWGLMTFVAVAVSGVSLYLMFQGLTLYYLVLIAIAEEIFVRGFLLPFFSRLSNVYIAVVASSIVWAVYHIVTSNLNPSYFLYIFISGLVYGYVDILRNSLTPSLVSHVLINFFAGVMG